MNKNKKRGQVALIVLLIMVVLLTLGISLISRSVTDVKISQDEKEALRAFSAAEAGVEEVLRNFGYYASLQQGTINVEDTTVNFKIEQTGESSQTTLENGEVMNVSLEGAPLGLSQLTVNWVNSGITEETSVPASLEIIIYKTDYSFRRLAYNPVGIVRNNGFDSSSSGDSPFTSRVVITGIDTNPAGGYDKIVRIRPFYNKTTIRINSNSNLPPQLYNIISTATYGEQKTSKIVVARSLPVLPSIFDYVLFSGGDL